MKNRCFHIILTITEKTVGSFLDSGTITIGLFLWLPIYFVGITAGMTLMISDRMRGRQRRAEKALRKSYEELEERVAARTEELSQSDARLTHEIEEHEKAERALRESEEKFRLKIQSF